MLFSYLQIQSFLKTSWGNIFVAGRSMYATNISEVVLLVSQL